MNTLDLQRALKGRGFDPGAVDGYMGPKTRAASVRFLNSLGLTVTPAMDPVTMAYTRLFPDAVVATSGARPRWVVNAIALVGTKEFAGAANNPTIMGWAKKIGGSIARIYTADSIPWCALFTNYVCRVSGFRGFGTLWALDVKKWGRNLKAPALGAFVGMTRNGGGHVAIIIGRTADGDLVCVGGNQSDNVTIARFDPSRIDASDGYRWPAGEPLPARTGMSSLPIVPVTGARSTNEA